MVSDTLNELAAAMGDNANTQTNNAIATKADQTLDTTNGNVTT